MSLATLNGIDLPCWFQYKPLVPEKRVFYKKTAGGIVSQRSSPSIISQGEIPFTMTAPPSEIAEEFCKHWYDTLTAIPFTGYYGESYEVEISQMTIEVKGGVHYIQGVFQVLCTIIPFCPSC